MAETTATLQTLPQEGFNISDATFEATTGGSGNGHNFPRSTNLIALKNDSGSGADFYVKMPQPAQYVKAGVTIPDMTIGVADGKTYLFSVPDVCFGDDGYCTIESESAMKILGLTFE